MNKRAIAFLQKMEEVKKAKANKNKQLQEKPIVKTEIAVSTQQLIPIKDLKTQFPYTCEDCKDYICYDTLFINDLTGRYIPLDRETMRPHRCRTKKNKDI